MYELRKNLQVLRKTTNLTQENLAEKLDVSRQTVSKWEQNLAYPEIEKLIEVCELFHCSVDQILREDMIINDEAYSEIRIVTVEPFRYIPYAVVSVEPEDDAIIHVRNWAKQLKIDNPHIIGWDFPNISQEQSNVFHMHGYSAALVLDKDQEIGDIDADVVTQEKQKYITITIRGTSEAPFVVIPNAYKALLTHMKTNKKACFGILLLSIKWNVCKKLHVPLFYFLLDNIRNVCNTINAFIVLQNRRL